MPSTPGAEVPPEVSWDREFSLCRQQYTDFLGREPGRPASTIGVRSYGPAGTDAAVGGRVVPTWRSVFISQEFQLSGSYLYNIYKGARLDRGFNEYASDRQLLVKRR